MSEDRSAAEDRSAQESAEQAKPDDALLRGVRIVECSMLGPAAITTALADLGADVIKVEPPQGDYVREMTWPIVEGTSLMHLHLNRGKRSVVLDLRTPEGAEIFLELVREADAVVEAMRPGGLERRGPAMSGSVRSTRESSSSPSPATA